MCARHLACTRKELAAGHRAGRMQTANKEGEKSCAVHTRLDSRLSVPIFQMMKTAQGSALRSSGHKPRYMPLSLLLEARTRWGVAVPGGRALGSRAALPSGRGPPFC